jgi:hypothetical protein
LKLQYFTQGVNLFEQVLASRDIQSDQKENKSEQALQIIGHVVAESYANKHAWA